MAPRLCSTKAASVNVKAIQEHKFLNGLGRIQKPNKRIKVNEWNKMKWTSLPILHYIACYLLFTSLGSNYEPKMRRQSSQNEPCSYQRPLLVSSQICWLIERERVLASKMVAPLTSRRQHATISTFQTLCWKQIPSLLWKRKHQIILLDGTKMST